MDNQNQAMPDISSMLSGILSNPQALSAISSLLGNLNKGQTQNNGVPASTVQNTAHEEAKPSESSPTSIPAGIISGLGPSLSPIHNKRDDRERALLLALKPFLSKSKCDTVDLFIRMLDLISLIGKVR